MLIVEILENTEKYKENMNVSLNIIDILIYFLFNYHTYLFSFFTKIGVILSRQFVY